MDEARRLDPDFDMTRSWDFPADTPPPGEDESLEDYLRRLGFSETRLDYTRRSFANATGEAMRYISAASCWQEWHNEQDGEGDFRILDGYDRLIDHLAAGLDIRLETIVSRVDWSGEGVRIETANGGIFEADRVVITLPVGVLQSGSVNFTPELPADKLAAINNLRMGPVFKMVYCFDQPLLPDGVMALYSALNPPMWWSPSFGQHNEPYIITAFVSGDGARELLADGENAALAGGLEVLKRELNRPDLHLTAAHLVNWPADPFALGGYSVAQPGHADARAHLALPTGRNVYWAGEATAPNHQASTVHGAYVSGRRAAAQILSI